MKNPIKRACSTIFVFAIVVALTTLPTAAGEHNSSDYQSPALLWNDNQKPSAFDFRGDPVTNFDSLSTNFGDYQTHVLNPQPLLPKHGLLAPKFRIQESEIEQLNLGNEIKNLLKDTFSVSAFGSNVDLSDKQASVRSALEKLVKDSFVNKKGIWVPKNNEPNLLPALNEAYRWTNQNKATNDEFNDFLLKALNQPHATAISSYDPSLEFNFDACPDCQIIGANGLVPFNRIEELAMPTLMGSPATINQNLLPRTIGNDFTSKVKILAASTMIMTVRNRVKKDEGGVYLNLPTGGFCQRKVSNHCSSFPNRSGTGVYTANHCVKTLLEGYDIDPNILQLNVGDSENCSPENPLRFVGGINDVRIGKYIDERNVKKCKSITKLADDSVFIELRGGANPISSEIGSSIVFPNELKASKKMEAQSIQRFRRTVGFGFAHTQALVLSNGGYVADNLSCQKTFDEISHGYQIPSHDPLKTGAGDFLCVSTDSLNGMSGGPVFSIIDGNKFAMVGVFSFAYGSTRSSARSSECIVRSLRKIDENTDNTSGAYNVISRLR